MTGILKVDQWKDSGDNTLMTSDGAGVLTANAGITIPSGATITNNGSLAGNFGKIAQVLQGQNKTVISTSLSLVDFDVTTISITPTATSSKILILCNLMGIEKGTGSANTRLDVRIYRDSTQLTTSNANRWTYNTNVERDGGFAINWLDSPSSTSAINYRLNFQWLDTGGSTCYVNKDGNSGYSTITVMEVLA